MTKRQGLRLAVFIVLLGIVLNAMVGVFGFPPNDGTVSIKQRFGQFYSEPENTWDCVMVGASCVDRQWVAPIAWKDYGMTAYPMNTARQPLILAVNVLKEVREKQDVKLAVVDIRGIRMAALKPGDVQMRNILDNMRYSKNRYEAVKKMISFYKTYFARDDVKDGEKMLKKLDEASLYFPFLKYHSRWKTGLYESDFVGVTSDMKGVYELKAFDVENVKPTKVLDERKELNELQISVLDEIMDYGKETGLEILFVSSPSQLTKNEQPEITAAVDYLESKGANVINFNTDEKYQEIGIDFSQDLYNGHHLNSRGAVKFTNYFAKYLHEHYQFEDKRGREEYKDWDEAYENYVKFYEAGWKKAEASK